MMKVISSRNYFWVLFGFILFLYFLLFDICLLTENEGTMTFQEPFKCAGPCGIILYSSPKNLAGEAFQMAKLTLGQ